MRRLLPAVLVIVLLLPVTAFSQAKNGKEGVYEQLDLFGEAFERIRQDAVESVGDKKLVETAISGMLTGLDPHSAYISESAYKAMSAPTNDGNAASLGMALTLDNGLLKVISPRDGSPAAQAGIKPGDVIFTVDNQPVFDLALADIEQRLRGPAGTEVALTVRRGTAEPMTVKIKRAVVKPPVIASRLEGGDIGYLRIPGFDDATQAALTAAIQSLRQQAGTNLIGYVVDLRNNPGGSFDVAVEIADDFLDKGDITVVKSRKPDTVKHIAATPGDLTNGLPIVALVNGGTASEAELIAAALQGNHRAVLLGTKTYGESAIESIIPLHGAGAIRLTTARFETPSGQPIQGKGLTPDLTVVALKLQKIAQLDRQREADLPGALKNTDPIGQLSANPPAASSTKPAAKPANTPPGTTATAATGAPSTPTVAASDIGTENDEQLGEALDVLRGLALTNSRRSMK